MTTREFLALHKALSVMNPDAPQMSINAICRTRGVFAFRGNSQNRRSAIRKIIHQMSAEDLAQIFVPRFVIK